MQFQPVDRVFEEPETSYFLFGPRGTGKSTLAAFRHPGALLIDLRLARDRLRFSADPDLLKELVEAQPDGTVIVIDEIQKVPNLLSVVHLLIEEKRRWKFILTGSSARKLKQEGVDLLGGRALRKVLHPFMAIEIADRFTLDDALAFGLLPLRFSVEKPLETLESYISLYLEEEIKVEGLVRNIEPFIRFLQTMSFSHASILNVSNISRECHVKRTTVDSWISILEDMLISYQIQVFTNRAKRELSVHPKFYFFDCGVFRALRPFSLNDQKSELDGHVLEGLVAQHLVAWKDYTNAKHTLNFWRTRSGVEVDFILFGPLGFWAIEVKNSKTISLDDLKPLEAFMEDYPEAKGIFLYRGQERLYKKNILCMPVEAFLTSLTPNKSL
ncbi:MAG: ATP-binding protein [Verrucomicrobia bacterium]|nr:ATP-binding protein [Verrucomicrobiota bacterium]MBS0637595.1 ATP-binding protein [Verrucomicrobiota bacterium]